jgi:16S rRNA (adenine1518-N6/adenine1519-N6)-dimethyltransferase
MHFHHPRKRFGQHFLVDDRVLAEIVAAIAPQKEDYLIEIGPGQGQLTQLLVNQVQRLDVIEIDRDLVAALQEQFHSFPQLTIYNQDILKFNWGQLTLPKPLRIVGNLPYKITTPLLFQILTLPNPIQDCHFLLQKEVVDRLTAPVGSHNYSRLTVMSHYFADLAEIFTVPSKAFFPAPKVESAFIRITPHPIPPYVASHFENFSRVVKEAFTYRRKTLANSLRHLTSAEDLKALNIDPQLRPQQITVENFVKISNIIRTDGFS